jgi:hypothetical protein
VLIHVRAWYFEIAQTREELVDMTTATEKNCAKGELLDLQKKLDEALRARSVAEARAEELTCRLTTVEQDLKTVKEELAECRHSEANLKKKLVSAGGSASSTSRGWLNCPSRSSKLLPDTQKACTQDMCWQLIVHMEGINALLCSDDLTIMDASMGACKIWGSGCLYGQSLLRLLSKPSSAEWFEKALNSRSLAERGTFAVKDFGNEVFVAAGQVLEYEVKVATMPGEPSFSKPPALLVIMGQPAGKHKNDHSSHSSKGGKKHEKHKDEHFRSLETRRCVTAVLEALSDTVIQLSSDKKVLDTKHAEDLARQEALFGWILTQQDFASVLEPADSQRLEGKLAQATRTGVPQSMLASIQRPLGQCKVTLVAFDTGASEASPSKFLVGLRCVVDVNNLGEPNSPTSPRSDTIPRRRSLGDITKLEAAKRPSLGDIRGLAATNALNGLPLHKDLDGRSDSCISAALQSVPPSVIPNSPGVSMATLNANHCAGFAGGLWRVEPTTGGQGAGGDFTAVGVAGTGGQGVVMHVKDKAGSSFALKKIKLPAHREGRLFRREFPIHLRNADREVRTLKSLSWASAVIVRLHDCWIQDDFQYACIVMEWVPRPLSAVLQERCRLPGGPAHLRDCCRWFAHIATGVAIIHSSGFMHRDLKPSNMLLTEDLHGCKIADLGVGRALQTRPRDDSSQCGTNIEVKSLLSSYTACLGSPTYMSPEVSRGENYNMSTDMYSMGCVLFELLTSQQRPEDSTAANSVVTHTTNNTSSPRTQATGSTDSSSSFSYDTY